MRTKRRRIGIKNVNRGGWMGILIHLITVGEFSV